MKAFNKTGIDFASLKQAASHYRGEGNYCSVISLAIATGCKFGKARAILARELNRKDNDGTHGQSYGGRVKGQHEYVYPKLGKRIVPYTNTGGFMISNSAKRLPKTGTFLVYSSRHVTCVKDGVVHDWCVEVLPAGYKRSDKRMKEVYQVLDA